MVSFKKEEYRDVGNESNVNCMMSQFSKNPPVTLTGGGLTLRAKSLLMVA